MSMPSAESPASGSSSSTSRGAVARQRASSISLSSSVVRPLGSASARSASPTCARARPPRRAPAPTGALAGERAHHDVFRTVRCGNVRTTWNVRPTPRRQSALGRSPVTTSPRNRTSPAVGDEEAVQHVEERGLAGAVGPDDAEDLALAHLEADVRQGLQTDERLRDAAHVEQRRPGARGAGRRRDGPRDHRRARALRAARAPARAHA